MTQDDLGAALLRQHPRGGQWQQLDITVADLTFAQTSRLAEIAASNGLLEEARGRVIAGLAGEVAGRLASRWVRWLDTFGLPMFDPDAGQAEQLAYPYQPAATLQRQMYLDGVVPLFDAALGILGAPTNQAGNDDCDILTAAWRQVCLPAPCSPATAYGPDTQAALSVLGFAIGMPATALKRMVAARAAIDEQRWQAARVEADTASIDSDRPYRSRCLYWEAVAVAEQAAGVSPTDRELVDALWAAAVVQILPGISPAAATLLRTPYRASGAILPGH